MTKETLLSASRRFVRFFNIDESHGGLISHDTLIARDQLQIQLDKERRNEKARNTPIDSASGKLPD